ncbi:MAG: hypothetical protein IIB30_04315, partial [Chloroflexi bacterium]|nr:hypothetical protein [Chloroflexota bacterium]
MDTFFVINLGPETLWRVSIDDPESVPLESFPHLNVINPLLHARYFRQHHLGDGNPETVGVGESYAIVKSPFVLFGMEFAQFLTLVDDLRTEASIAAEKGMDGLGLLSKNSWDAFLEYRKVFPQEYQIRAAGWKPALALRMARIDTMIRQTAEFFALKEIPFPKGVRSLKDVEIIQDLTIKN